MIRNAGVTNISVRDGVAEITVWVRLTELAVTGRQQSEFVRAAAKRLLVEADEMEAMPFEPPPGCTEVDDAEGVRYRMDKDEGTWGGADEIGWNKFDSFDALVRARGPVRPLTRSQPIGPTR